VPYFASFNYKTPSFKSVFLGGLAGTGRSMIMTYIAMYAFKNNWILITTPNVMKWTQDRSVKPKKLFNGLFVIE
jgi:ABC-type thiamin/hydroxymethylpyrimidine transport system permease subunit